MKATELLQKQHREIEQLLERLRNAAPEQEAALREELASMLVAHTVIEQEHFYPAVREIAPDRILEALEEHGLADYELARDLSARPGDQNARARGTVLGEVVLAHVRKEENDIFRRAENEMTNQELAEIGEVMLERYQVIRQMGYERFLAQALAENMPRIVGRAPARKAAKSTRRAASSKRRAAAPAKKKATTRRAAPKRTTGRKAETPRVTSKRGAAGTRKSKKQAGTSARGGRTSQQRGARSRAKKR
jgi:hemerythrin superfamily protein